METQIQKLRDVREVVTKLMDKNFYENGSLADFNELTRIAREITQVILYLLDVKEL